MIDQHSKIMDSKLGTNYITLKMEIKKEDVGKDIPIINQCHTYKLFKNFELENIELYINNERQTPNYKYNNYYSDCTEYNKESKDKENSK